mmetsp:Transcript_24447/g.56675  ORF Transcript_24447/g.56675 Transcript_24447/m.56675 type:complete len:393 (+) Transcript_24447:623-1801(+)
MTLRLNRRLQSARRKGAAALIRRPLLAQLHAATLAREAPRRRREPFILGYPHRCLPCRRAILHRLPLECRRHHQLLCSTPSSIRWRTRTQCRHCSSHFRTRASSTGSTCTAARGSSCTATRHPSMEEVFQWHLWAVTQPWQVVWMLQGYPQLVVRRHCSATSMAMPTLPLLPPNRLHTLVPAMQQPSQPPQPTHQGILRLSRRATWVSSLMLAASSHMFPVNRPMQAPASIQQLASRPPTRQGSRHIRLQLRRQAAQCTHQQEERIHRRHSPDMELRPVTALRSMVKRRPTQQTQQPPMQQLAMDLDRVHTTTCSSRVQVDQGWWHMETTRALRARLHKHSLNSHKRRCSPTRSHRLIRQLRLAAWDARLLPQTSSHSNSIWTWSGSFPTCL